jgi:hypothetical protein
MSRIVALLAVSIIGCTQTTGTAAPISTPGNTSTSGNTTDAISVSLDPFGGGGLLTWYATLDTTPGTLVDSATISVNGNPWCSTFTVPIGWFVSVSTSPGSDIGDFPWARTGWFRADTALSWHVKYSVYLQPFLIPSQPPSQC